MNKSSQKQDLWIAIRLTQLPLDVLIESPKSPTLVVENNVVCACDIQASRLGVAPGLTHTVAQVQIHKHMPDHSSEKNGLKNKTGEKKYDDGLLGKSHPNLNVEVVDRDRTAEEDKLLELCDELYLITPYIKVYNKKTASKVVEQGIVLEVSTCINLFKGVKNIRNRISEILSRLVCQYNLAYGYSERCAWLLSYLDTPNYDYDTVVNDAQKIDILSLHKKNRVTIGTLDIKYLYDFPKEVKLLNNMGFSTFDSLIDPMYQSSFKNIHKRLGDQFIAALDELVSFTNTQSQHVLFGTPKTTYHPQHSFSRFIDLDYPLSNSEHLKPFLESLLDDFFDVLTSKNQETHSITWTLYDFQNTQKEYEVSFNPKSASSAFVYELSIIQLENSELPFEVNQIQLSSSELKPRHYENLELGLDKAFSENSANAPVKDLDNQLSITTARLSSRIGRSSLSKVVIGDSHIPELASMEVSSEYNVNAGIRKNTCVIQENTKFYQRTTTRPEWIFKVAKSIGSKQNQLNWQGKLNLIQGPERIQGNWWHKPIARDYFIAQREDCTRLWVYHDLKDDNWYAQGIFS